MKKPVCSHCRFITRYDVQATTELKQAVKDPAIIDSLVTVLTQSADSKVPLILHVAEILSHVLADVAKKIM